MVEFVKSKKKEEENKRFAQKWTDSTKLSCAMSKVLQWQTTTTNLLAHWHSLSHRVLCGSAPSTLWFLWPCPVFEQWTENSAAGAALPLARHHTAWNRQCGAKENGVTSSCIISLKDKKASPGLLSVPARWKSFPDKDCKVEIKHTAHNAACQNARLKWSEMRWKLNKMVA